MRYLYKLYLVVEEDNCDEEIFYSDVEIKINDLLQSLPQVEIAGSLISELDQHICGKCANCGVWVSDSDNDDFIEGFSDGCIVDNEWFCDLCLPSGHRKKF